MEDIHNYRGKLEHRLEVIRNAKMPLANKKALLAFHDACLSQGISPGKVERYLYDMAKLSDFLKIPFKTAGRKEIQQLVVEIERHDWSVHTKHGMKVVLKKFYKWLRGIEEKGVYPEEVRWLSTNMKKHLHVLPEALATEAEIMQMLKACATDRDRAFLACLYETGARISEIATIKLMHVQFDEYGAVIVMNKSKTGGRRVRVIFAAPYLRDWINKHPLRDDPNAYVWVKRKFKDGLMGYKRFAEIVRETARAAGIKKRVYAHLFRHSRATYLAKHLPEPTVRSILGWVPSSRMIETYVHLSGKDTDDALLRLYGIEKDKGRVQEPLQARVCGRCNERNQATNKFCSRCGLPLDEQVRNKLIEKESKEQEVHRLMNDLVQDEEFFRLLLAKVEARKAKSEDKESGINRQSIPSP